MTEIFKNHEKAQSPHPIMINKNDEDPFSYSNQNYESTTYCFLILLF